MYVQSADVIAAGTGLTANAAPPASPDFLDSIIERVSRLFDIECGVSEGYFEAADTDPTNMTFYGNGTNYLRIAPYIAGSITAVSVPSGTVPDHVELDGYLVRCDSTGALFQRSECWGDGWRKGAPVTITARWGYASTPADVQMAIIEWVIDVFRGTDPASAKLVNVEGLLSKDGIPARVAEVASQRRLSERRAVFV